VLVEHRTRWFEIKVDDRDSYGLSTAHVKVRVRSVTGGGSAGAPLGSLTARFDGVSEAPAHLAVSTACAAVCAEGGGCSCSQRCRLGGARASGGEGARGAARWPARGGQLGTGAQGVHGARRPPGVKQRSSLGDRSTHALFS
jgi:hypothetical protein